MALDLQPAVRPTPSDAASGAPASDESGGGLSLAERGKTADGAPQSLDRRLFVQFLAYTDCTDPARLADAADQVCAFRGSPVGNDDGGDSK